jgi:Putative peptidoglycan binding domain
MSDISLLMTGVLTTGHPSGLYLPEQPVIQLDSGVQESTQSQETDLVSTVEITPPEFMQLDETTNAAPSAIALEKENILSIITGKIVSVSSTLAQSQDLQVVPEFTLNPTEILLQNSSVLRSTLLKSQRKEINKASVLQKMNLKRLLASTSLPNWKITTENISTESSLQQSPQVADTQDSNSIFVARSLKYNQTGLPILRFGNSGVAVRVLQRLLSSNGYAIRVDGVFGALTEAAVKAFQNQRNLSVDGIVGSRTWNELTK